MVIMMITTIRVVTMPMIPTAPDMLMNRTIRHRRGQPTSSTT